MEDGNRWSRAWFQPSPLSSAAADRTAGAGSRPSRNHQSVRWRPDGSTTAPTASVGMVLLAAGETLPFWWLSTIRFIETAASAKLNFISGIDMLIDPFSRSLSIQGMFALRMINTFFQALYSPVVYVGALLGYQ